MNRFLQKLLALFYRKPLTILWIAFALPLFLMIVIQENHQKNFIALSHQVDHLLNQIFLTKKNRLEKNLYIKNYQSANPQYLKKIIEPLHFCQKELSLLEYLFSHPVFFENPLFSSRIHFLKTTNFLTFKSSPKQQFPIFMQNEEKLTHPIQMDWSEFVYLINLLEGACVEKKSCNRPDILIKKMHLDKIQTELKNEVLLLDLDLIKRELLQ